MKKAAALLLCTTLAAGALTACGGNKTETTKTEDKKTESTKEETTDAGEAKTGLAVITSLASSTSAGEEDGLAQTDSTVVAVLVDAEGKILDCKIDSAQTKINFTKEGKLATDTAAELKSKQELGADYGLGKASSIKKEWNEQADAFAEYAVGKTVDEIKGVAVNEEGVPADEDLKSSVTIHVGDFVGGIEKAAANAKALGAGSADKLGLGVTTEIANSTDAAADEEGLAEAYSMYSAVTTDADGKITSCYVDATQGDVNFDTKGVITSDLKKEVKTKQELGDDYGMKKASSIGKEWFEQADAFAEYAKGKTASDVSKIAVSEEGLASDEDLISSVTVHVSPFITVVEKAAENAK